VHETGLALTALEIAAERTRERGATRIHRLVLRVGDLSGVVPDALRFAPAIKLPPGPARHRATGSEQRSLGRTGARKTGWEPARTPA
jgi:hypothetical protein